MATANTANVRKVDNPAIKYGVRDLTIGVDNLILAYEHPVEMTGCGAHYRVIREETLRRTLPDRITYQIGPVERCLDPDCPPAKKALEFIQRRIKAGWRELPNAFRREQDGEEGVFGRALSDLKRSTTALHNYLGQYVVMD
jgi:hypothetical protein